MIGGRNVLPKPSAEQQIGSTIMFLYSCADNVCEFEPLRATKSVHVTLNELIYSSEC